MTIREKLAKALIWLAIRIEHGWWPDGVALQIRPPETEAAKLREQYHERTRKVIDQALANAAFSIDLMRFPDASEWDFDRGCPRALHRGTMQDPVLDLPAITTKPITEVN